ncbi:hypothetical protein KFL_015840020 [Klebsormidium nitens]|uniref:CCHC-type domain-containing protein n=1 Tax=Klebsormidium nitens TaxID=105231 RepID=A0A1Y1IVS1_KLENI|nr:hypothetical protein KFL_015840020 [Klebsormidium nitens]|eukprot:GAQ93501.1 hypothetical protein KFL_015840020 [Klebsormidium nitens]
MKPDNLSFSVRAGLSSRFEGVVTVLTTTKKELGKVEELLPTLQVFEQRHGLFAGQDSGASGPATAVAYATKGGNFGGKGKGGPGKASMACHKCGKLGHFARECRSGLQEPEKPKSGKKCYICGSPDHFKRECPKKGETGGRQGVAFVAGDGVETGRWIVDSGASQHITGVKSSFSTLKMLEPGTRAIKFGNKGFLEVAGVGTVELRCETHSGERVTFSVCEVSMDGEVMLRAEENAEGLSVICQPTATWEDTCLLVKEAESPVLWHRRLGHAGYESLAKMVEGPGLVRGVGVKAEAFREKKTEGNFGSLKLDSEAARETLLEGCGRNMPHLFPISLLHFENVPDASAFVKMSAFMSSVRQYANPTSFRATLSRAK